METEDELDDTPLFTRMSSQKLIKDGSVRSLGGKLSRTRIPSPETEDEPFNQYKLKFLQATLLATVLEDTLTQMRILAQVNNELRNYKMHTEMGELRKVKFGIQPPTVKDELANIDTKDLMSEHHKLNKVANDRKFCTDVLTSTYLELALDKSFSSLAKAKQAVIDRHQHYFDLIEEEARNKALNKEIKRQLRHQRNRSRTVVYDTNLAVEKLKNDVEDASLNKEVRSRYIDKWQKAREEQHERQIEDKEKPPIENIAFYRKRLEAEQRVHYEQELHTNILINDILRQLDVWVDKYDDDTAAVDLKIQIKKIHATAQKEKRIEMEQTLALHEEEMKNWKQFKEDRERAIQYQKMMTEAAHVVQAWWRGLLVRQELGPYKPKRKPPPKSDKKKKK